MRHGEHASALLWVRPAKVSKKGIKTVRALNDPHNLLISDGPCRLLVSGPRSTFVDRTSHVLLSPANRLRLQNSATRKFLHSMESNGARNEAGFHSGSIHRSSHIGIQLQFGRVRSG